jgi:hypothetical protein
MYRAETTTDGGYILGGWSESYTDGNKTAPNYGERDCWVIKTDPDGNIEWQTTVGGDLNDYIFTLHQLSDGGYIFGGFSESGISGNKTEPNLGAFDYYVFKLDSAGNLVWQNTIGGSGEDRLHAIIELEDGSFLCGGTSESDDYDHTAPLKGIEDYWVLKLDSEGNILWDRTYGGDMVDELFDIQVDTEGNFIFAGFTTSELSGDVTEPIIGIQDGWAVKINADGDILWQNTIGGSLGDRLECAYTMSDGNYFMGSGSYSPISGDQVEHSYDWEYWLKKLDKTSGDILWQVNYGGFGVDLPRTIIQTSDNSFAICGESTSDAGLDKTTPNYGNYDYWIIKLSCEDPLTYYADTDGDGYGDSAEIKNTCTAYPGFVLNSLDCNDADATVYPDATEICNAIDDNCNGTVDEGAETFYYLDGDGYGFCDPLISVFDCPAPAGYVADNTDCDDANEAVFPGSTEICNYIDDNCDTNIDEGVLTTYFADADGDLFGNSEITILDCTVPDGYSEDDTDCDDSNAAIYPGAEETLNGVDDNCNGSIDEGLVAIEETADSRFQVYPNPVQDQLRIVNPAGRNLEISLTDPTGRHILTYSSDDRAIWIETRTFSPGLYLLTLNDKNSLYLMKIVKE